MSVRDAATTVCSRFLETGCTLQDLLPLVPEGNRSLPGTVNLWLDRLVASGQLTAGGERDALWAAYRR